MRKSLVIAAAALAAGAASPAIAGKLKFSPATFQIYGGLLGGAQGAKSNRNTRRQTVSFETELKPGSVVVRTASLMRARISSLKSLPAMTMLHRIAGKFLLVQHDYQLAATRGSLSTGSV